MARELFSSCPYGPGRDPPQATVQATRVTMQAALHPEQSILFISQGPADLSQLPTGVTGQSLTSRLMPTASLPKKTLLGTSVIGEVPPVPGTTPLNVLLLSAPHLLSPLLAEAALPTSQHAGKT